MTNLNYKYGIKHYWNYFKINYYISIKKILEYKGDIYAGMIYEIMDNITFLLFGVIFIGSFGEIFNWSFVDYVALYFFSNFVHILSGLLWYRKDIEEYIISGNFNTLFNLPGNRFLNYFFKVNYNAIVHLTLNLLILFPYILYYGNWTFLSLFLSFSFCLILMCFFFLSSYFFDSFSWKFLKLGPTLNRKFLREISDETLYTYPGALFQKTRIKYILYCVPLYFVATIVIPLFNNKILIDFWNQLIIIISLCFVFIIGIWINWEFGLKKYEAYN